MKNIKIVFCDVDGTLLDDEKACPRLNIEAIAQIKAKGLKFGIATGRPVITVLGLIKEWGLDELVDYVIGSNGAEVYDLQKHHLELYFTLDAQTVIAIERLYSSLDVAVCVYNGKTLFANKETERLKYQAKTHKLDYQIVNFKEAIKHDYPKVLLMMEADYQFYVLTYAYNYPSSQYRIFPSSPYLLECVNPQLSKSFGIKKICDENRVAYKDVLCFGDTSNDIEMLQDFTGVWMRNGTEDAKKASKFQTISNNEAGVGVFLMDNILK